MNFLKKKGFTLIASVILIIFTSITALSLSTFIVQRFTQNETETRTLRAIYLAQAGINDALYWYRQRDRTANGAVTLGQVNIDANNSFVLSANDADLLMVNTSGSNLAPATGTVILRYRQLRGWNIQNATNSRTITIVSMTVTWNGVPTDRRLQQVWLSGAQRWPPGGGNGAAQSGDNCNINNFTLNRTPSIYSNNRLIFNYNMTGATVDVQFFMSDGSNKTITLYTLPVPNTYNFNVNSLGQTIGSNLTRTVRAEYNARTGRVADYREIVQ